MARDSRGWGVGGWRVLRKRHKAMLSECKEFFFFFLNLQFNSFPLLTAFNHCYSYSTMIEASITTTWFYICFSFSFLILRSYSRCFIHFNTVFFNSRQYLAGKCTSTNTWPIVLPLHLVGDSKCCHNYLNCLQKRKDWHVRLYSFFYLHWLISF